MPIPIESPGVQRERGKSEALAGRPGVLERPGGIEMIAEDGEAGHAAVDIGLPAVVDRPGGRAHRGDLEAAGAPDPGELAAEVQTRAGHGERADLGAPWRIGRDRGSERRVNRAGGVAESGQVGAGQATELRETAAGVDRVARLRRRITDPGPVSGAPPGSNAAVAALKAPRLTPPLVVSRPSPPA